MTRTLLVTDDSMIIREIIKDLATASGWQIAGEATNGQEAVDRYRDLRPDAVTLDMVMPGFDGLYALGGIRAMDQTARVLVVSAIDQVDILKEAVRLGATDFVVKPFDKQRLRSALDKLVVTRTPSSVLS